MEGYARLKSTFGFTTIWLVLDGQDLAYYESLDTKAQCPKKLKGVLNVRDGILKKFQQPNMQMGIKIKNAKKSQKLSFDCPNATAWNSWFNALNRAIKEHIEEFKKVQLPYEYRKVLEIDPDIPKLNKAIITRAYKKISLREHPDKGGNADNFSKITEAYSYLINYQTEMDARENNEMIHYEAIIEKANGVGLGIHLIEDKLREQFVVTQVEESIVIHGLSAESRGEIRAGDALIAIDQDEISHWYFSRLKARLDTTRVPFGAKVLLVFERRISRDDDEITSNISSPPCSPIRTRPAATSANTYPSAPSSPIPSSTSYFGQNTESRQTCSAPSIVLMPETEDSAKTSSTSLELFSEVTPSIVASPPDSPQINSTNVQNSSLNEKESDSYKISADALPAAVETPVVQPEDGNESNDDDDDDDDDCYTNTFEDEDGEGVGLEFKREEQEPKIAHEDVMEVLRELETSRSLNNSLQAQNEELTRYCETLSQTLRAQEDTIQSQDDTIRQLHEENEKMKHENSTMRGLLLHDQFPQTAERMKEYLLLLQKEVIGLRTQLKQFDPLVMASNGFGSSKESDANQYAAILLQQQYQRQSTPFAKHSQNSPNHHRQSSSRSNSVSKQRMSQSSSQQLSPLKSPKDQSNSSPISGTKRVYHQREERAKTVEIKLRDLLSQTNSSINSHSSSGELARSVDHHQVQRRLSTAQENYYNRSPK